jgi:hypothetical protein
LSALTKIGIVLLVVTSLLLSAGVVVFVNKVEHFKLNAELATAEKDKEFGLRRDVEALLNTEISNRGADRTKANERYTALQNEKAALEAAVVAKDAEILAVKKDKAAVDVVVQTLTAQATGLQQQIVAANQQVTELRGVRDKLVEERFGLNNQLTDALAKVEATERARKLAEERAARASADLDVLRKRIADAGFTQDSLPVRTTAGTPSLEGVVHNVFLAGNKPWASISIGSKDNVTRGMRFNVHNNEQFLGYLTIQTTEPTEAAGVLEGPGVDKVKAGDQVKTQLQ